ncbi:MAG: sulfur carrier protein ThiS [Verrucomicrobia bacterium]|nr:MAG: sulfur carrier protein ThiS [Verrucomicrobiota bacterium]
MQLQVNGEPMERPDGETLAALLAALGAEKGRVATMVNDDVVPAAARATHRLAAGDRIEILTFAGGG